MNVEITYTSSDTNGDQLHKKHRTKSRHVQL